MSDLITRVELPAVVLHDALIVPHMAVPLELEEEANQQAVRVASGEGRVLLLFALPDRADRPVTEQIHSIGVIAQIQAMQRGNGTLLIAQGVMRAEVQAVVQTEPYLRCVVQPRPDPETWDEET